MKVTKYKIAKIVMIDFILLQFLVGCIGKQAESTLAMIHPPVFIQAEGDDLTESLYYDAQTFLAVKTSEGTVEISLQDYLVGVLQGELPVDFPIETMKAQAIAARTVALKKRNAGKGLCDDPNCCQAFVQMFPVSEQVVNAVTETDGQVLVYENELIEAVYFSCSGGMTEAAVDVWGNEVAYLQALASPGEESAPRYEESVTIPKKVFLQKLETLAQGIEANPNIGDPVRTEGGGVKNIVIGGVAFTGTQLRELFNLRSTSFEIEMNDFGVRIHCRGFGHRVGLSQYGAKAMAENGADYRQILSYYYPGTEIKKQP